MTKKTAPRIDSIKISVAPDQLENTDTIVRDALESLSEAGFDMRGTDVIINDLFATAVDGRYVDPKDRLHYGDGCRVVNSKRIEVLTCAACIREGR